MDEIQKGYYKQAQELCEIMSQFHPCEVVDGEDRTDYHVKMQVGGEFFRVSRDWKGNIVITLYQYERYNKVSHHVRGEVYKKYPTNNMKVPTLKKVVAKVNACISERDDLRRLQKQAEEKERMFLCDIEASGLPVEYRYNYVVNDDHEREKTDINGGMIVKNGVCFDFSFKNDGFISQRLDFHYEVKNTLKNFIALSENNYRDND